MKTPHAFWSLLTLCCLLFAVAPAMADTLYSNGPYNGTKDAYIINFGFQVADSFTVPADSSIQGLHFVYWDGAGTGDVVTTVDIALGADPLPESGYQTLTGVTNTLLGVNQYGYSLFQADFSFNTIWSGDGWITLQNACTTSGCSVVTPIYWDDNNGPSMAKETFLGSIPSEAFTLTGGETTTGSTPEPGSIMLFSSGILGLACAMRRNLSR